MKRPEQSVTDEFREWSRKRFLIKRYIHDVLGLDDYGHFGHTKDLFYKREETYRYLPKYAPSILANALMDSMSAEKDPISYCEELFGIEAELDIFTQTIRGKNDKHDPIEKIQKILNNMSDEQREQFLELIKGE